MSKRLTITDILKQKEEIKAAQKSVEKVIRVERLDAEVVIEKPSKALCLESMNMTRKDETADLADAFLVYSIMKEPNLKDRELQKEFSCVEPTDIVDVIFEPGEVTEIANYALELAGYKKGTISVVEDLKN